MWKVKEEKNKLCQKFSPGMWKKNRPRELCVEPERAATSAQFYAMSARVHACVGMSPFNSFSIHSSHNVSHLHGFQLSNYLPMTSAIWRQRSVPTDGTDAFRDMCYARKADLAPRELFHRHRVVTSRASRHYYQFSALRNIENELRIERVLYNLSGWNGLSDSLLLIAYQRHATPFYDACDAWRRASEGCSNSKATFVLKGFLYGKNDFAEI